MAEKRSTILSQAQESGLATPRAGMSVPDGYFESFTSRMSAMLPERPELEHPETIDTSPRTLWERVRPYVYMAAMFAGVWLMLQMFSMMSSPRKLAPMDDNLIIANALSSDEFLMDYLYDDIDDWSLVNDMIDDESLQGDFQLDDLLLMEQGNYDVTDTTYILPQ